MNPNHMRELLVDWYNNNVADFDAPKIEVADTYVVWFCYTLGDAKALISTVRHDHMYYELTYNMNKNVLYVDQYLKVKHTDIEF